MKLKVGDSVRIIKDSRYYVGSSNSNNPKHTKGIIKCIVGSSILVGWINGYENSYLESDLELFEKSDKYNVNDIVLMVIEDVENICELNDYNYEEEEFEVRVLYGEFSNNEEWFSKNLIKGIATKDVIEEFCKKHNDVKYRVDDIVVYENQEQVITCYETYDYQYLLEDGDWVDEDVLEKDGHIYEDGDYVFINDYEDTIAKIVNYYDDSRIEVSLAIGSNKIDYYYSRKDISPACKSDVDILSRNYKWNIGDSIYFDGSDCEITAIDTDDDKYCLDDSGDWYTEEELIPKKADFEIGDKVICSSYSKCSSVSIYEITDYDEHENTWEIKSLYSDRYNNESYVEDDVLEKISKEQLEKLLIDNNVKFRIGEEGIYYGEKLKVLEVDMGCEEYFIEDEKGHNSWIKFSDLQKIHIQGDSELLDKIKKLTNANLELKEVNENLNNAVKSLTDKITILHSDKNRLLDDKNRLLDEKIALETDNSKLRITIKTLENEEAKLKSKASTKSNVIPSKEVVKEVKSRKRLMVG